MKEVMIIAIWDKGKDVMTRSLVVDMKSEHVKLNGKKPNKLIVPESCKNQGLLRKVRNMGTYNCTIVTATGK